MRTIGGRPWLAPVGLAVAVYALSFALLPKDGFWINDNGCKFIQMEGLVRSGYRDFSVPWPGRELDPAYAFNPLREPYGTVVHGRLYVIYSIVFAILSSVPWRLLGPAGLYLLPLLGGLLLLPAVWVLAGLLQGGRAGRALALLIVALATPLWFYSLTFWEHVPAACLAVWSVLFLVRHAIGGGRHLLFVSGLLCGMAIWFRSDLYLLGLILAALPLVISRRDWRAALTFAAALALALAPLWLLQWAALGSPLGLHITANAPLADGLGRYVAERFIVARNLLLDAHGLLWVSILVSAPYVALLVIRPRVGPDALGRLVPWLAAVGAVGGAIGLAGHLGTPQPISYLPSANGLFAVSPILILAFLRPTDAARPPAAAAQADTARCVLQGVVLASIVAYLVLVQARMSTGIHWGCRLLLHLYPLLGVLAASTIGAWWDSAAGAAHRRRAGVALIGTCLALSVAAEVHALRLLYRRAAFSATLNRTIAARPENAVITVGWFLPQDLAHVFYTKKVFLARRQGDIDRLMALLRKAGEPRVLLLYGRTGPVPSGSAGQELDDGLGFITLTWRSVSLR